MKIAFSFLLKAVVFVFLTALTQIGGLVYLLALFTARKLKLKAHFQRVTLFLVLYTVTTFIIVPILAPLFGREKIKHSEFIQPTNYMTVILNRNYVVPEVNSILANVQGELRDSGIYLNYLDANFPFITGFPLLPHLSHNDGRKLDLSLVFETSDGKISAKQKSRSGYGVFVEPKNGEFNQTLKCKRNGYDQYDYSKYMTFGKINEELVFSPLGTTTLLKSLLKQPELEKLFIEPHLKTRLKIHHNKVRFHGCRSVRHDDHIHIQVK